MADVIVDQIAPDNVSVMAQMYNQVFRPARSTEDLERRYLGRHNVLQLVAEMSGKPVGFLIGFELKPRVFYLWFMGVLSANRRQGVASQLEEAMESWCRENDYELIRCECLNLQRPMMHFLLHSGYDVTGIRWDADHGDNLLLWQKSV